MTKKSKGSGAFIKFIAGLVIVVAVLLVTLSLSDIGGGMILLFAQNYLGENYKLSLTAEKITGNPIRGYTLQNFELADSKNKILSAGFLSGRVSFPALFTGKLRLAEVSLGGLDMDVDNLMTTVENLKNSFKPVAATSYFITPAYADEKALSPSEIPVDRFSIKESRLTSQYGTFEISELGADLINFDVDVDGKINGLPVKGDIDISTGLTNINRSDINFGSGKITATGGLAGEDLDFHATFEGLDLSEITALYPEALNANDFSGKVNLNADVTGAINSPRVAGTLDYKGSKIFGFPVERASANLSYSNYRLAVSNLQANVLNVPIQGEIAAANRPNENISVMIKLDGTEANLDGLDKILNIPELKTLSGKVASFSTNISGYIDSLSGLVNFSAPRISYQGRTLTNIKAQMKLAKSDTANVDGKFNFEGSNGFLQGTIASFLTKPSFNLTAKIVDLDVKRIENMIPDASDYKLAGAITAAVTLKGNMANPSVTGSINSPAFSGFGQTITKPVVNFSFANKTLTLSKIEGTLNGMPVNLSGTITPLPSDNPKLNINATIAMTPASLQAYVPDIKDYSLKGTINAGVKIQGSVNQPSINLLASSPNLQAMNMITAKDIELTTTANGDLAKLEKIDINASAKSIVASGVNFNNLKAAINKNGDKISLSNFSAASGPGTITGNGTASTSGKENLNFNFKFDKLALASLASASGVDLNGDLSGNLKIAGKNSNPEISFNAAVPVLNAMGFALNNLVADISGTAKGLNLNKVTANVEGSEITATGNVQLSPMKFNIALNGSNIKLEELLKEMPDLKDNLAGTAALSFNITGDDKATTGKGTLTAPSVKAYGTTLTNLNLPLNYSGNSFASNNGTASLYGGTLKNSFNFDIKNMRFTNNIEASGVDVNNLIQDASGGLGGKITGKGKLTMRINGSVKDTTTYSGSGNFSMGSGAITGFKWLDLITRIHNSNGIQYTSVNAPLSLQTGKLIIKSGAIANANKNDALYKYARLIKDGVVNFGGKDVTMDFTAEGAINYQLINAIQGGGVGGLTSLLTGGTATFQDGLKTFISGGFKGAEKVASTGDFRIMSMRIAGKAASPSFSNLKIGESTLKAQDSNQTQPKDNALNAAKDKVNAITKTDVKKEIKEVKEKFEDKVINSVINVIAPKKNTPTPAQNQNQTQPQQEQKLDSASGTTNATAPAKQSTTDKIKNALKDDKNRDRLKNELKKGLGGLFK